MYYSWDTTLFFNQPVCQQLSVNQFTPLLFLFPQPTNLRSPFEDFVKLVVHSV